MRSFSQTTSCLTVFLLLISAPALGQRACSFTFTEDWAIGDDESADPEYLFTSPTFIATDSEGNVYVADHNRTTIRVFDGNGRHFENIGRSGEGPGEFREITSMAIDTRDRLVVFDHMNHRITRITDFDQVETVQVSEDELIHARLLLPLPDGRMVAGYKLFRSEQTELFHIYNEGLERTVSFGKPEHWDPGTDDYMRVRSRSGHPLRGTATADTSIVVVNRIYHGQLLRYTYNQGEWSLQYFEGIGPPNPPYEFVDDVQYSADGRYAPGYASTATPEGSWQAMVHSLTAGLSTLNSGHVVHLVALQEDGRPELLLQLFNPGGELVTHCSLSSFPNNAESRWPFRIQLLWVDKHERFYFVDRRDRFPVIRAMRPEGDFPE